MRGLWVNELDTIGDRIANIAEMESHAPGSEAWRSQWVDKNLGDGDKQIEDDDDETVIDLKEYTCVEKIWRQWMSECRLVETLNASCFHCTNRRCC